MICDGCAHYQYDHTKDKLTCSKAVYNSNGGYGYFTATCKHDPLSQLMDRFEPITTASSAYMERTIKEQNDKIRKLEEGITVLSSRLIKIHD